MNTWLFAILAIIIASHLFECLVSWLNLQALHTELPEEFIGVFSPDDYKKSQEYIKATTGFAIISSSVTTITTLLFLILGGFNTVDFFARSFGYGEIFTGLIFTGCLALLTFLLDLPFRSYLIFVIEERFGFNRMTIRTYLLDILKAALLMIFLGGPLLALIFWFFLRTGEMAWVYCWLGVSIFSFLLQYLAPAVIMPLFNTFSPLANASLKEKIMEYAERQHFYIRDILTMDGSKRSSKLNAFFTGFGRFRKIVFFDTLLAKLSEEQLLAVLAHEIGHFRLKHIWAMLIASFIQTGIMFFILSLILNNRSIFDAFGMTHTSVYASLVFFTILFSPLNLFFSVLINHISRSHEFAADSFAVSTAAVPGHLISGLKILSRENLSNLTPHPLHVLLHSSHPPILERIKAIRRLQSS
jgi:STE24 endopeptidase